LLARLTLLLRSTNKFVSLVASKEYARLTAGLFLCSCLNPSQLTLTAPVRVASDQQTAQWAFAAQQPASRIGLGVPAASMFYEHLTNADDAALKRLATIMTACTFPMKMLAIPQNFWVSSAFS